MIAMATYKPDITLILTFLSLHIPIGWLKRNVHTLQLTHKKISHVLTGVICTIIIIPVHKMVVEKCCI